MSDRWVDEMGDFVVHLGFTPRDYWSLSLQERDSLVAAFNRKNRKRH